ncbi:MAG: saccharopine dehydrogenase family protein [Candidatus Aminicenantes bacterium]|nr:saccharopine dehydrogenase family protein [Candidatus Aminicenantes bacterium]
MKIIVLGSGLVGAPTALDLAADPRFEVAVADRDPAAFDRLAGHLKIKTVRIDLSDPETVTNLAADYDLALSAVPGFMGFQTLKAVIAAGKSVVDIAFFPEDPFLLRDQALSKNVTAVVDCGVAPGMSNLLVGHVDSLLEETRSVLIYVGGLPEIREWPYEYKAVFSPADVLEEYVRPARYIQNGALVVKPALSEPELLEFPGIGTLEAFNTDGLRTLARTISAPNMKEKTLRYPGHIEKMAMLRETGFFSSETIEVGGVRVRPLDVTSRLLFPKWKLREGEADLTVMKVVVEGRRGGEALRYTYDLLDRHNPATSVHSMARTTGYTASCALRMLAGGLFEDKGIIPPEFIGRRPDCVKFMLDGLRERGVIYRETVERIDR